jgi:hypothetical protein
MSDLIQVILNDSPIQVIVNEIIDVEIDGEAVFTVEASSIGTPGPKGGIGPKGDIGLTGDAEMSWQTINW